MKSSFDKLKFSLAKTRKGFLGKITGVFGIKEKVDDEMLQEIEQILIEGDIGVSESMSIIERLQEKVHKQKVSNLDDVLSLIKEEVYYLLVSEDSIYQGGADKKPWIILVVGVNGTGKTTTIGKLAYTYKNADKKVLLAAADTYRAAAIEQLEIWCKRAGVDIIKAQQGSDPAAIAYDSVNAAISRNVDVLIIDTAGRIHTKMNLMEELKKIKRVVQKQIPDAPHEVLLVLDAQTGQNGIIQAKEFLKAAEVTGIVLTKLDGTAKGGVVIPIRKQLGIPVKYIGIGEDIKDLEIFEPKSFVEALFTI